MIQGEIIYPELGCILMITTRKLNVSFAISMVGSQALPIAYQFRHANWLNASYSSYPKGIQTEPGQAIWYNTLYTQRLVVIRQAQ